MREGGPLPLPILNKRPRNGRFASESATETVIWTQKWFVRRIDTHYTIR
jgi:hypothetical protein